MDPKESTGLGYDFPHMLWEVIVTLLSNVYRLFGDFGQLLLKFALLLGTIPYSLA